MADLDISKMEEFFKEELDLIKLEINATDELYDELKEHFDKIKRSSSPGALSFITKQTPNLVSLKGNKISLIKDLVNAKKVIIETSIKTKPEEGKDKDDAILQGIHRLLLENKKEDYIDNINNTSSNIQENSSDYYDKLLEDRIAKINLDTDVVTEKIKDAVDETSYIYVVDLEKNIYVVDKDYNMLENVAIPSFIIEYREIEEETRAFNQYGEELEIISLEE